jgi:hypothetical protein
MSGGLSEQVAPIKYFQGTLNADGTVTKASTNNNGTQHTMQGYNGAIQMEVVESNGGTATLAFQGSFDSTNWYAVGYYQVDNNASLSRSVSNVSVTANMKHVYQLLDPYPQVRAVLSSVASTPNIVVRAYCIPA